MSDHHFTAPYKRTDRSTLAQARSAWENTATSHQESRASDQAYRVSQKQRVDQAKNAVFIKNLTQGSDAVENLTQGVAAMKSRLVEYDASAAQLYGTALTLQRTAFTLASLMQVPYNQFLGGPGDIETKELLNLRQINRSLGESTRVMVHAINVLKLLLIGQARAKEQLEDVTNLFCEVNITDSTLLSLAEGTAPPSYTENLADLLASCQEYMQPARINESSDA